MTAPRSATVVTYQGEPRTMSWLCRTLHINKATLCRWMARGILSERVIVAHLSERRMRLEAIARARQNGISARVLRERVNMLGWPLDRAATEPLRAGGGAP